MALLQYATEELKRAGWLDKDSDYAGMVGPCVVKMVEMFAEEGHSGYSAHLVLSLFQRVARFRPLTPIDNPLQSGEYVDHTEISGGTPTYQSTRLSSLFSEDGGKRWYDIDVRVPKWKRRLLGIRRHYVQFPYSPK